MIWKPRLPSQHLEYPTLPLNLRPGAILTLNNIVPLLYKNLDLDWPEGELMTESVSVQPLFDLMVARAYAIQDKRYYLLQVHCTPGLTVKDATMFQLAATIYPGTPEEWGTWLSDIGLIGAPDITTPNGRTYVRDWGDGPQVSPVAFTEHQFTDIQQQPRREEHKIMLYSRKVEDISEYLLLSADNSIDKTLVRAWIGVNLGPIGLVGSNLIVY
ncbi:DUF2491 family protein [Desulfovibrionales bacterium]